MLNGNRMCTLHSNSGAVDEYVSLRRAQLCPIRQENRQIEEELATYKDEVSKYKVWRLSCVILFIK